MHFFQEEIKQPEELTSDRTLEVDNMAKALVQNPSSVSMRDLNQFLEENSVSTKKMKRPEKIKEALRILGAQNNSNEGGVNPDTAAEEERETE